ncbi:MAG: glycosyltransferase family 4 protein [Lachnospiraceae bacterium]|nr:glycosyltransferase family 4 protein [Lachnospiraceae bacterium]
MKILYLTLSRIDLKKQGIYSDLINALKDAGHAVTLVQVMESGKKEQTGLSNEEDVTILRVAVGALFNVNFITKGINTVKIGPLVKAAIKKYLKDADFDLVLYATPPITFAGVVKYAKKRYGCRSFLMLKDIFPQNAADIGLFSEKGPLYLYFRGRERALYALSDRIGCMSAGNREYLLAHNPSLPPEKVSIFPNTMRVSERTGEPYVRKSGEPLRVVFGGNFGRPQAIGFLIDAIADPGMQEINARFLFVGNGSETEKVREAAERLPNMEYIPFMEPDKYDAFMQSCDVGLISLDHRFTIPNYPSRILSYMAMAKPVIACTDPVTDMRKLVEEEAGCGLWCESNDTDAFRECVRKLEADPAFAAKLGECGRQYLETHFDVAGSVKKIEEMMKG